MTIKIHEGKAWVYLGHGCFLCIGTKRDIAFKNDAEIGWLFLKALAISQYDQIERGTYFVH